MQRKALTRCMAWLTLAFLITGCESSFTGRVWEGGPYRHVREPAAPPNPSVFYETHHKDYLVSYDSVRDGGDAPRRLNYFISENPAREPGLKKPVLVSISGLDLIAVPLNPATNALPQATFDGHLTIHTPEGTIGPCDLPAYVETKGLAAKIALTPLTVVGDVTCVSLIAGVIAAAYNPGLLNSR